MTRKINKFIKYLVLLGCHNAEPGCGSGITGCQVSPVVCQVTGHRLSKRRTVNLEVVKTPECKPGQSVNLAWVRPAVGEVIFSSAPAARSGGNKFFVALAARSGENNFFVAPAARSGGN